MDQYLTALPQDPNRVSTVWDPNWERPEVAAKAGRDFLFQILTSRAEFPPVGLVPAGEALSHFKRSNEARSLNLTIPGALPPVGVTAKASSYGRLLASKRFGPGPLVADYQAHAVGTGFDDRGRFFLRGGVLVRGVSRAEVGLAVVFATATTDIGGIVWSGEVLGVDYAEVLVVGEDPRLREQFAAVTRARVAFFIGKVTH